MTAPVRRGRPGYSLERLLDVAVEVFNERGYEAATMDELALRLGITKSAASSRHIRALRRLKDILSGLPDLGG